MKDQRKHFFLQFIIVAALLAGCGTPLIDAAKNNDVEAARKLLEHGADANVRGVSSSNFMSTHPFSALDIAVSYHSSAVAKLLIDKGADVNLKDSYYGETPLHSAAYGGFKDMVELLLAKGADARITNNDGKTPRMLAEQRGYTDIAKLLSYAEKEGPRRLEDTQDDLQEVARFEKAVLDYRKATKPAFPEEARKYKVQAEGAVLDKQFDEAANFYGKALEIAPWWPEGHFNRALVLGESRYYLRAIREMKRYLALVPDAPDARAAQDKVYEWERKSGK